MNYPCLLIKKIIEISPSKYNPRTISDESMGRLTKSLAEFGNIQPITWNARTGNVVGGHQRLKVYQAMGKTEVEVWAVDLSEQKEKAANIALNKLSGEFDMPMLKDILEEIDTGDLDMEVTGFAMDEIAEMMESVHPIEEDEIPEVPIDAITKLGDLWILGEHRVLCGDSTSEADVSRLMNGAIAELGLTDPPYGVGRDKGFGGAVGFGGTGEGKKPIKRRMYGDEWDTERPPKSCLDLFMHNASACIVWGGNFFADILPRSTHWLVWDKLQTMPTFGDCELAWTNSERKSIKKYTVQYNGLIGKEKERFHPTQKPVKLLANVMTDYSEIGWIVFDPFLGSGTTLIAAEQLGRKCYGMEISPNYCDVIVKRWENLTNKKATLAK